MRVQNLKFLLLMLFASSTWAAERLGQLELEEFLVKPTYVSIQPKKGNFSLEETSLTFRWTKETLLARVRLGSTVLIAPPAHYDPSIVPTTQFGFFEAYAQINGPYGQLRMGLVPLDYGVEGSMSESVLMFPRSLWFRNKITGLRDYGLAYHVANDGYFTSFAVTNGEGAEDRDNQAWLTSSWGWSNERYLKVGVSGQTGQTTPASTTGSTETLAAFDPTKEALWRTGVVFLDWHPPKWQWILEANLGDLVQDGVTTPFRGGHTDLIFHFSDRWALELRYDGLDPNLQVTGDMVTEGSFGVVMKGQNLNSMVYLIGTKKWEEGPSVDNDELRLIWRLTPNIF